MTRMVRAVITADNHLNRHYDRMSPQRLEERRRRLRQGFHLAVDCAIERQADLFIHAGDLFDTPDPRNVDREFVAAALARLRSAGVRVVACGGNHDTPKQRTDQGGALPQGVYAQLGGLRLFEGNGIPSQMINIKGLRVAIGALPWSPVAGDADPMATVEWAPDADIGIFLFHHSVEGHIFPDANEAIVTKASLDRLRNTHLVVAGHVHHRAEWRMGPMQVLIPGATELMTFGDTGTRSFSVADLVRGGVASLEAVEVPCQPRVQVTVRTTDLDEAAGGDICAAIMRRIETHCASDGFLRLHVEGPITRDGYRALDLPRLYAFGVERTFYFDVDTGGLFVQDETGQRAIGGVRISQREELTACADEMIAQAVDPSERDLLEETKQAILASYEMRVH